MRTLTRAMRVPTLVAVRVTQVPVRRTRTLASARMARTPTRVSQPLGRAVRALVRATREPTRPSTRAMRTLAWVRSLLRWVWFGGLCWRRGGLFGEWGLGGGGGLGRRNTSGLRFGMWI